MTLVVSLWICSIVRSKPFMTASTMRVCKVARSAANSRSSARPSLWCHPLVDLEGFGGLAKDLMKPARGDGQQGIAPEEQPRARLRHPPVVAQDRQQAWREQ